MRLQDYVGMQKIQDIVSRCRLGHAFEQVCIAFAATSQFKDVVEQLESLLKDTFSGWVQTRVNEKANKVWRDTQLKESWTGLVATVRLWEKLSTADVLGEFGRREVETTSALTPNSEQSADLKALFKDPKPKLQCSVTAGPEEQAAVEKENEWLKQFEAILLDSGKSFNPESEQVLTAELRLLRTLNEGNLWHRANDAWLTSLLPIGALIRVKVQHGSPCLWVLKTNESAALCWPAERTAVNM